MTIKNTVLGLTLGLAASMPAAAEDRESELSLSDLGRFTLPEPLEPLPDFSIGNLLGGFIPSGPGGELSPEPDPADDVDHFICIYPELDEDRNQVYIEPDFPSYRAVFALASNSRGNEELQQNPGTLDENGRLWETFNTYSMDIFGVGDWAQNLTDDYEHIPSTAIYEESVNELQQEQTNSAWGHLLYGWRGLNGWRDRLCDPALS